MKFAERCSEGDIVVRFLCMLRSVPVSNNLPFLKKFSGWLVGSQVALNLMSQECHLMSISQRANLWDMCAFWVTGIIEWDFNCILKYLTSYEIIRYFSGLVDCWQKKKSWLMICLTGLELINFTVGQIYP